MSNVAQYFGRYVQHGPDHMGLELELEQVKEVVDAGDISHICKVEEDHSLRNSGLEFISNPCSLQENLEFCHDVLESPAVKWHDKSLRCTERGSVHVHLNMLHSTIAETIRTLRFYCMLEPQFFAEVAPHRRNNIYCVSLMSTAMPRYIQQKSLTTLVNVWHKYTALNAKRLSDIGTLEFRHLQATDDLQVIERWLRIILNLKQAARDIREDNITWPMLLELHQRVFGKPATLISELEMCFQEDVVNRQEFTITGITQRIKEAKTCAA